MYNYKLIYTIAGVIMVAIIGALVYIYFSLGNDSSVTITEAPTTETVVQAVSKEIDLSKDALLYSSAQNGTLNYYSADRSFVLKVPENITDPRYDREKKQTVESNVATHLGISIEQLCYLNLTVIDYKGNEIPVDICLGEE